MGSGLMIKTFVHGFVGTLIGSAILYSIGKFDLVFALAFLVGYGVGGFNMGRR